MAGVMMEGDEGMEAGVQSVPAIGGVEGRKGMSPEAQTVKIAATAHLNENRAEGVAYPENPGVDVTTSAYPAGTDNGEASNPLK